MADIAPSEENDYQAGSTQTFSREIWNVVMGSIAARLKARELLEATFETLISNGTQAALDMISTNVAPQLSMLVTQINDLQAELEDLIGGGVAPNSLQLGGKDPAFYLALGNMVGTLPAAKVSGIDAMIAAAVAGLVNSAPGTMDTLKELADALGNDANFATNVTNALGNKLDKSGGIVTGPLTVIGAATFAQRPAFNGATPWDSNNLPAASLKWRTILDQTLAAPATGFIVPVGSCQLLRGRLFVVPNTAVADFTVGYRTSFDNGSSYAAGAADYLIRYLSSLGTTAGGGDSVSSLAALSQLIESTNRALVTIIDFEFFAGLAESRPMAMSKSFGLNSTGNGELDVLGTFRDASGVVTHLSVLASAANGLGIGTRLIVEGA